MAVLVSWELLGGCRIAGGSDLYGGLDLALHFDDATVRGFGLRTPEVVLAAATTWDEGYRPIPVDRVLADVGYWSFDEVLWLGPEPRPCIVWTNAVGLRLSAVDHLLRHPRAAARLLSGRDGQGLPELSELSVVIGS